MKIYNCFGRGEDAKQNAMRRQTEMYCKKHKRQKARREKSGKPCVMGWKDGT